MKDQELQQLYDDGYTAFEQKKYTECADKILAFLHEIGEREHKDKKNALNLMGIMHINKHIKNAELGRAITYYEKSLACDPNPATEAYFLINTAEWYEGYGDKPAHHPNNYKAFDYKKAITLRESFLSVPQTAQDEKQSRHRIKRLSILANYHFDDMLNALLVKIEEMESDVKTPQNDTKKVKALYKDLKNASYSYFNASDELSYDNEQFKNKCQKAIDNLGSDVEYLNLRDIINPSTEKLGLRLYIPVPPLPKDIRARQKIIADSEFDHVLARVHSETKNLRSRPDATKQETDAAEKLTTDFEQAKAAFLSVKQDNVSDARETLKDDIFHAITAARIELKDDS